jgi:hypothetical protein
MPLVSRKITFSRSLDIILCLAWTNNVAGIGECVIAAYINLMERVQASEVITRAYTVMQPSAKVSTKHI